MLRFLATLVNGVSSTASEEPSVAILQGEEVRDAALPDLEGEACERTDDDSNEPCVVCTTAARRLGSRLGLPSGPRFMSEQAQEEDEDVERAETPSFDLRVRVGILLSHALSDGALPGVVEVTLGYLVFPPGSPNDPFGLCADALK